MDLKDVKNGSNYESIQNSRNLDVIMTKQYWETGKVKVVDTHNGSWLEAKVNGSILLNVSHIKIPKMERK